MTSLYDQIPALTQIREAQLRDAVHETWRRALETSMYDDLRDAPQSPHAPDRNLLSHVNEVNHLALQFMEFARVRFDLAPDADLTLAAAILHDVDKLLLYRRDDSGNVVFQDGFTSADHGPRGADLALECGLPVSVADLIRFHSPFNYDGHLPGTAEGTIVHYADLAAVDLAAVQSGRQPIHARTDIVKRGQ